MVEAAPIVVLGTARSGTTALAQAVMAGLGGFPYGESGVLPLLGRLLDTTAAYFEQLGEAYLSHPGHLVTKLDRAHLEGHLKGYFKDFCEAEFSSRRWVDKTANSEMIRIAPVVAELFDGVRFLVVQRRGIDMVLSRQRKFPRSSFRFNCEEWVRAFDTWQATRPALEEGAYLEIEQRQMLREPEILGDRVADLLGFDAAAKDRMVDSWKKMRPERTAPYEADAWVSLSATPWSAEERILFVEICGATMARAGYPLEVGGEGGGAE